MKAERLPRIRTVRREQNEKTRRRKGSEVDFIITRREVVLFGKC